MREYITHKVNTNLHFVNTHLFSEAANHFLKYNHYTNAPKGTFAYKEYWDEQERRCKEGYSVAGVRITGEHYAYINFARIKVTTGEGKNTRKYESFPRFLDMDFYYYHELEQAKTEKQGMIIAKSRRKGFSYKGSFNCVYEYTWFRDSFCIISAFLKDYCQTTMNMAIDMINFINKYTDWGKRKLIDKRDHIKSGFKETINGIQVESGYKSELVVVSFKDDPYKAIGKSASTMLFEECGKWIGLVESYMLSKPLFSDGDLYTGIPILYGCVCAGTKVWTNSGELINIEDLQQSQGILGFNNQQASPEDITYLKPPAEKPCYRISTTTGTTLECSSDHPILWSKNHFRYAKRENSKKRALIESHKKVTWKEAKDIKKGDQLALINSVSIFGEEKLWEPRLLGMLIGDGSYGYNKTPILSNCDPEINTYIDSKFTTVIEKSYLTKTDKLYRETRIKNICQDLRKVGIYGQTKDKKTLPSSIYKCDKNSVCELLGGLFDTDGCILNNKGRISIVLTSAYLNLIQEVKNLCIKLGIHGCINKVNPSTNQFKRIKDVNPYYRFSISDNASLFNFYKNIKLLIKYKQERLNLIPELAGESQSITKSVFVTKTREHKDYAHLTDVEGIRFETVKSVEFIGNKEVYNLTAGNTHTYIASNIITHNTGGDMEGGTQDFAEMFYSPGAYGLRAYENTYDENALGECGWFVDDMWFKLPNVDKDGNSDRKAAEKELDLTRELTRKKATSRKAIDTLISQHPKTPQEAFLKSSGNIFPASELLGVLARLETDKSYEKKLIKGYLVSDDLGNIELKSTEDKIIYNFPLKKDDNTKAPIIFYEQPFRTDDGQVPYHLYIAATDPYQQDVGQGSLATTFVMNKLTERIVAEYTAKPDTTKDYYENVRKLLLYYNCKSLYENNIKGMFDYFESKNCLYLLEIEPEQMINDIIKTPSKSRKYGMRMNDQIKRFGELLIYNWLVKICDEDTGVLNLHQIRSIGLLKELVSYSPDHGNYDRVSALLCLMFYLQSGRRVIPDVDNPNPFIPFHKRGLFARKSLYQGNQSSKLSN